MKSEDKSNFYLNLPWMTRTQLAFRRRKPASADANIEEEDALLFMKYRDECVKKPDGNGILRIQEPVRELLESYDRTIQCCRISDPLVKAGFEGRSAGPRMAIEQIIHGSYLALKEDPIPYFVFQSASANDFNLKQVELVMCYGATFNDLSRSYILTTFPTEGGEEE
jgi:hypothetical protein